MLVDAKSNVFLEDILENIMIGWKIKMAGIYNIKDLRCYTEIEVGFLVHSRFVRHKSLLSKFCCSQEFI